MRLWAAAHKFIICGKNVVSIVSNQMEKDNILQYRKYPEHTYCRLQVHNKNDMKGQKVCFSFAFYSRYIEMKKTKQANIL